MNFEKLKWGELKHFAKKKGLKVTGKKKSEILKELNSLKNEKVTSFKGVKEKPIFFKEMEKYVPSLKAFVKLGSIDSRFEYNKAIATLFIKHIEVDKNASVNLNCGNCMTRYYRRMIAGYNKMALKHGEPTI